MSFFNLSEKLQTRKANKEKVQQARALYFVTHPKYKNYKSGTKIHGTLNLKRQTFTCLSSVKIKEGQIFMDKTKSVKFNIVKVRKEVEEFKDGPVTLKLDFCIIQILK